MREFWGYRANGNRPEWLNAKLSHLYKVPGLVNTVKTESKVFLGLKEEETYFLMYTEVQFTRQYRDGGGDHPVT